MKKAFELLLVLIIFYGVYSVFDQLAPMMFDNPKPFHIIVISLIVAALLLVLYAAIISGSTKAKIQQQLDTLNSEVKNRDLLLHEKDQEIKRAQSFVAHVVDEAEKTIDDNE